MEGEDVEGEGSSVGGAGERIEEMHCEDMEDDGVNGGGEEVIEEMKGEDIEGEGEGTEGAADSVLKKWFEDAEGEGSLGGNGGFGDMEGDVVSETIPETIYFNRITIYADHYCKRLEYDEFYIGNLNAYVVER